MEPDCEGEKMFSRFVVFPPAAFRKQYINDDVLSEATNIQKQQHILNYEVTQRKICLPFDCSLFCYNGKSNSVNV